MLDRAEPSRGARCKLCCSTMYITTIYHNNCTLDCRKFICMDQVRPCPIWDAILSLLVWPIPLVWQVWEHVWWNDGIGEIFLLPGNTNASFSLCSRYLCMARRWGANGFTRLVIFTIFRWLEVDTSLLGFVILKSVSTPQSNPLLKSHLFVGSRSVVCFNYLVVYGRILKTCGPYPISRTTQQLIFLLVKHPISVDQLHLAGWIDNLVLFKSDFLCS